MGQLGIFRLRFASSLRFRFLSPIGEHLAAQLSDLFDGASFCLVRGASFSNGLIDHISNAQQPLAQSWTTGEALIEALFGWLFRI